MRLLTVSRILAIALVVVAAISLGAGSCSSSSEDSSEDIPAIAATVHIVDGAFEPRDVEIEPGGSVMWINDDLVEHSLTFLDTGLRSGVMKPTRTWIHTFDAVGDFPYYDDIRNTMKGSVVVRPAP